MEANGKQGPVLVVDDDDAIRRSIRAVLRPLEVDVQECADGTTAIEQVRTSQPGIVLLDLGLPDLAGAEVLRRLKRSRPHLPVVVVSANNSIDDVVAAMRQGAEDFVTKPFLPERLRTAVRNGLRLAALGHRVSVLEEAIHAEIPFARIIGCSTSMRALFVSVRRLANSSATVLIQGETGVGKDLVARALHSQGVRCKGPFVEVNCAAIPPALLENELFGHEREAFTGAQHRRAGKIEAANRGTLFLDEIAELDPASQAKLLRVLQDHRVEPLGGLKLLPVDVRVIAATNRDLAEEVRRKRFRMDLYYRISVCPLYIPPLRERRVDIPPLAEHFMKVAAGAEGKPCPSISSEAMELLAGYDWPGNVRELENVIRRAIVDLDEALLTVAELPAMLQGRGESCEPSSLLPSSEGSLLSLRDVERHHLLLALKRCRGNLSETARVLGIGRTTLYRKIARYGLQRAAGLANV